MIRDTKLDTYNRVLMYFLFLNYAHFKKEQGDGFDKYIARLNAAATTLPPYLAAKAHYHPAP